MTRNGTWRFFVISSPRLFPPIAGRPAGPDNAGATNRQDAWKGVYRQVRGEINHSDRHHMQFKFNILELLVEVFHEASHCEYPFYIPPQIAGDAVQMHHMAASRRTERHKWTSGLPPNSDEKT